MPDLSRLTAALAGRYAVERELGRGGMATVYVALDLKHHRLARSASCARSRSRPDCSIRTCWRSTTAGERATSIWLLEGVE